MTSLNSSKVRNTTAFMAGDGRAAHLEESDRRERHKLLGRAQFSLRDTVHLTRKRRVTEGENMLHKLRGKPNSKAFGSNTPGVTRGQIKYPPPNVAQQEATSLCGNPKRVSLLKDNKPTGAAAFCCDSEKAVWYIFAHPCITSPP